MAEEKELVLMILIQAEDIKRFWAKVKKTNDCWLWLHGKSNGYGYFWLGSRNYQAHRVAYILLKGALSDELELDHLCRIKACVNPNHLEEVEHRENMKRARKEFCLRGHKFDETNTRISSTTGRRVCRTCAREWMANKRAVV
jgi:hypothetical protein